MAAYGAMHKYCPECGCEPDGEQTCMLTSFDENTNRTHCIHCNWRGIIHDLVGTPEDARGNAHKPESGGKEDGEK